MFELKETSKNNSLAVLRGTMDLPTSRFEYPDHFDMVARIQQNRANTQPLPVSTARRPTSQNSLPTVPHPVAGIHTSRSPLSGNNVRVVVHFNRDVADTAYQSANVYLKQGNGSHLMVAQTSGTQTSFVVPKTGAASIVTVQSVGAMGLNSVESSPSRSINLL
jgi:hypothetical protein